MTAKELNRKLIRELHSLLPDYKISEKDAEKSPKHKVSVCIGKPGLAAEMMIYPEDYSAGIETDADIRKLAEAIADKACMVREMSEVVTCRSLRDSDKLDAFPAFMGMDLSAVPHYRVPGTDISLITRVVLGKTADTETSYLVTDDKLDFFGDDAQEILEKAMANTYRKSHFTITPLSEKFRELCGEEDLAEMLREAESHQILWLITNRRSFNGASAIAFPEVMKEAYRKIGEDFYILPSSRHELLAVSVSCISGSFTEADLIGLVKHVNETQVDECDRLSDSVFLFDGESLHTVTA